MNVLYLITIIFLSILLSYFYSIHNSSWIGNAALKFDGCASIPMFERDEGLRSNLVAKFKLCPNNSCKSCRNAGEYIVEMREFVETYQDALKESQEYECENANYLCETNCANGYTYQYQSDDANANANGNYNNNYQYGDGYNGNNNNQNNNNNNDGDDGDYCLNACLMEKEMDYCIEQEGQEEQDLNEFAECQPMENEGDNNNNNNNNNYNYNGGNSNYQQYYVGAYCTSSGVYAGVFTDSTCTKHAPSGTYEKYNYGYSLPTQPLVSSTCMSCSANNYDNGNNNNNNNNNNGNNNNNNGISEVCESLYEEAVKCEKNVKSTYKDISGCDMIHTIIPQLNSAMKNIRSPPVAKIAAWTFGIGFFALAGYIFSLHRKVGQQKMDLDNSGYCDGIPS